MKLIRKHILLIILVMQGVVAVTGIALKYHLGKGSLPGYLAGYCEGVVMAFIIYIYLKYDN